MASQAKVAENETILQAHTYGEVTPNGVRQLAQVGWGMGCWEVSRGKINGVITCYKL